MKHAAWLSSASLLGLALLTGLKSDPSPKTEDYQQAIAAAEQALRRHHINRSEMLLVALTKTLNYNMYVNRTAKERMATQQGGEWKVEYLDKSCLNAQGLRSCKGGGVLVTVNLLTKHVDVGYLE